MSNIQFFCIPVYTIYMILIYDYMSNIRFFHEIPCNSLSRVAEMID